MLFRKEEGRFKRLAVTGIRSLLAMSTSYLYLTCSTPCNTGHNTRYMRAPLFRCPQVLPCAFVWEITDRALKFQPVSVAHTSKGVPERHGARDSYTLYVILYYYIMEATILFYMKINYHSAQYLIGGVSG